MDEIDEFYDGYIEAIAEMDGWTPEQWEAYYREIREQEVLMINEADAERESEREWEHES